MWKKECVAKIIDKMPQSSSTSISETATASQSRNSAERTKSNKSPSTSHTSPTKNSLNKRKWPNLTEEPNCKNTTWKRKKNLNLSSIKTQCGKRKTWMAVKVAARERRLPKGTLVSWMRRKSQVLVRPWRKTNISTGLCVKIPLGSSFSTANTFTAKSVPSSTLSLTPFSTHWFTQKREPCWLRNCKSRSCKRTRL